MSFQNPVAPFPNVLAVQTILSPAIVATIAYAEQTFTVPGVPPAATPCIVIVNKPTVNAGVGPCAARNSAVNQIGVAFVNPTAGGLTPTASETWNVLAMW